MPIACYPKAQHGPGFCINQCPVATPNETHYAYARVERLADLPRPESRTLDVAVLDMNHRWPNLGHDSMVHAVQDAACDLHPVLQEHDLRIRCVSFEIRERHQIPEKPGGRFSLYLGTGGPGRLDPRENCGGCEGSQGLDEDPAWEKPLYELFEAILAHPEAALIAVCHTYGVMCRFKGIASSAWRSDAKGGKSTGVLENLLTPEGQAHPWFSRLAADLPDGRRFGIVDNRLYDLIPDQKALADFVPIAFETLGVGGPAGQALTMVEFARDASGVMPRVLGSNHHPEIVHGDRQRIILQQKLERGEVSREWYRERAEIVEAEYSHPEIARELHRTSDFSLLAPLRFHLRRALRKKAEGLGLALGIHENEELEVPVVSG